MWTALEGYRYVGFALVRIDEDGTIDRCTSAFAEMLGRDRASLEGQTMTSIAVDPKHVKRKLREKDLTRLHALRCCHLPDGTAGFYELETLRFDKSHFLSCIWRPANAASAAELARLESEKRELLKDLKTMHERVHQLMMALINQRNDVGVQIFNQQSDGDGNKNTQGGEVK